MYKFLFKLLCFFLTLFFGFATGAICHDRAMKDEAKRFNENHPAPA